MEELISNFGKDNPLFSQRWGELQDKTSLVLENQLKATNTPPESIKKSEISSQINFSQDIIKTNEKYGFLSQYIENITIGEGNIQVLNNDLYSALNRYSKNPEPLGQILGSEEKVQSFLDFLQSDKGSLILKFTQYYSNIQVIGNNLQVVNLNTNEPGKILSNDILNQTQNLAERITKHQKSLESELKAQKESQNIRGAIMTGNYATSEWGTYSFNSFEKKVINELYTYSKDVFVSILSSAGAKEMITSGEKFTLPVGENSITLDFSELPKNIDYSNLSQSDIQALTEKYFDDVYVDNWSEKLGNILQKLKDYVLNHPEKLTVDVVSIILSGLVAVGTVASVALPTGGVGTALGVGLAGVTFTASDNAIRTFGYGMIGKMGWDEIDGEKSFGEGALEGIGLKEEDLNFETIVTKKSIETLSNTGLFLIFNRTGKLTQMGMNALEGKGLQLSHTNLQKIMIESGKTIPEAVFFTYYGAGASAIEDTILKMQQENGLNREEAFDNLMSHVSNISDPEVFAHYFMYNLGFISLVKIGGAGWQKNIETNLKEREVNTKIESLLENSTKLDMELLRLQSLGYSYSREQNGRIVFYDKNLNKADVMNSDFSNIRILQTNIMRNSLGIQKVIMNDNGNNPLPNSGKGTKAQVNKPEIQVKYERLEKLSKEAEKQGLSFTLDRDTIYDGVSKSGVKEGTKDGLLREAGFEKHEIEAIKKQEVTQGSKKLEDRAVERMNSAEEKISRDFENIVNILLSSKDPKTFVNNLENKGFNSEQILKIRKLLKK